MNRLGKVVLIALTASLSGCSEGDVAGPCVHTYHDPVLSIVEARAAPGGEPVPVLSIVGITIDGRPTNPDFLASEPAFSVSALDEGLLCEVDCGFGIQEGVYEFRIEAEGYEPLAIELAAEYSTLEPGCPSANADGTELSVELVRAG